MAKNQVQDIDEDEDAAAIAEASEIARKAFKSKQADAPDDDEEDEDAVTEASAQEETDEDDEDGEAEGMSLEDAEDSGAEEDRRRARRDERKRRKERQRAARDENLQRIAQLEQRVQQAERARVQLESHAINQVFDGIVARKTEVEQLSAQAKRIYAQALSEGRGQDAADAQELFMQAQQELVGLNQRIQTASQQRDQWVRQNQQPAQQPQQQRQAPQIDPRVKRQYDKFVAVNEWFDPNGEDDLSAIALALDAKITKEGFDPTTQDFWDELQDRLEPHLRGVKKVKSAQVRKGPPTASRSSGSNNNKSVTVNWSDPLWAARKQAMMDGGDWNNPESRKSLIAEYVKIDKRSAQQTRR